MMLHACACFEIHFTVSGYENAPKMTHEGAILFKLPTELQMEQKQLH